MTITKITQEEHKFLMESYENYPHLCFQNQGYEYINPNTLDEEDKIRIKEIEVILKKSILGFSKFSNFRKNRDGNPCIRFQYNWDADSDLANKTRFIGVGYIKIDELLNGFDKNESVQ